MKGMIHVRNLFLNFNASLSGSNVFLFCSLRMGRSLAMAPWGTVNLGGPPLPLLLQNPEKRSKVQDSIHHSIVKISWSGNTSTSGLITQNKTSFVSFLRIIEFQKSCQNPNSATTQPQSKLRLCSNQILKRVEFLQAPLIEQGLTVSICVSICVR